MIQNVWNRILDWFSDVNERRSFLKEFNFMAKESFTFGYVPAFLEASISVGDSQYKLKTSKFLASGFRIRVMAENLSLRKN